MTETSLAPELVERGEVRVVDVRESSEWEVGHADGARQIEFEQASAHADTIDKAAPVVFQCRGGSRSELIAAAFRGSGWEAYNMGGGPRAWQERDLSLEPEGGHIEGA